MTNEEVKTEVLRRVDIVKSKLSARFEKQTVHETRADIDWITEPLLPYPPHSRLN